MITVNGHQYHDWNPGLMARLGQPHVNAEEYMASLRAAEGCATPRDAFVMKNMLIDDCNADAIDTHAFGGQWKEDDSRRVMAEYSDTLQAGRRDVRTYLATEDLTDLYNHMSVETPASIGDSLKESWYWYFVHFRKPLNLRVQVGQAKVVSMIIMRAEGALMVIYAGMVDGKAVINSELYANNNIGSAFRPQYDLVTFLLENPDLSTIEVVSAPNPNAPKKPAKSRRGHKPPPPPEVTVVELRKKVRKDLSEVEAAERTYHVRWIVRGHWRKQPYGPKRSLVRDKYIAPYVKGPDGAPLHTGEKVYRW